MTRGPQEAGHLDVRLFGAPKIYRNGIEVEMPQRKPAAALKILAVRGGVVHRSTLVKWLWPEDDPAVAVSRLRNVLAKARRPTGALIQERNDTVRVVDTLRCDVVEFIQLASRAVARIDGPKEINRLCIKAQSLWVGPPLEEDQYEPWAVAPRHRALELQRRLWDLLPPASSPER